MVYYKMMKRSLYFLNIAILSLLILLISSCIEPDYFTMYLDKNLIEHTDLTGWATDQNTTYMNWEGISVAGAGGTTGLPDTTALIYRIEMNNLVPDGDFETSADIATAGWTTTGLLSFEDPHPVFGSRALKFAFTTGQSAQYLLNKITDGAVNNSSYLFRFDLTSPGTGALAFGINTLTKTFKPNITSTNHIYNIPDDFLSNEIPSSEFTVYDKSSDYFIIDLNANPIGSIDNFRIVKTDQNHYSRLSVPYTDTGRVDELELINGTYRFSIYVKADPQAGSANHYAAKDVTMMIESFDSINPSSKTEIATFSYTDYSSFSEWTKLTVDLGTQITEPEDETTTVIRLSVCPGNAASTSNLDACSILVSNPGLYYSTDGAF